MAAANNSEISKWCKVYDCRFSSEHVTMEHRCGICKTKGHGQVECSSQKSRDKLKTYHVERLPYYLHCTRPKCDFKDMHTTKGHFCSLCSKQHSHFNCDANPEYIARKAQELIDIPKDKSYKLNCPVCRTDNQYSNANISSSIQEIKCCVCTEPNKKLIFLPTCKHFNLCTDCAEVMRVDLSSPSGIGGPLRSFGPDVSYEVLNEVGLDHFKGKDGKLYMQVYAGMGHFWMIRRDRIGELVEILISDSQFGDLTIVDKFINGYTKIDQLY